jgi:hypothetical protein
VLSSTAALLDGLFEHSASYKISNSTTSDNLTPQETIKEADVDIGPDGFGLSCPGSNLVSEDSSGKFSAAS